MKNIIAQVQAYIDANPNGEYALVIAHPFYGKWTIELAIEDDGSITMNGDTSYDPLEELPVRYPDYKVKGIEITTRTTYPINYE